METLLRELEFSFSVNGFANVTRDNFANPSLSCTSNSVMMSSDIVFANSDGSLTASALVDSGQNWINGVRTVNGLSFQLTRPTNVPVIIILYNFFFQLYCTSTYSCLYSYNNVIRTLICFEVLQN